MDKNSTTFFGKVTNKKEFFFHFLYWFTYVLINHIIKVLELLGYPNKTAVLDTLTKYTLGIIVFYITSYLLYPNFIKKWKTFILLLILLLFLHNSIRFIFYNNLFVLYDNDYKYHYKYWQAFPSGLWYFYQYSLFGLAFYIFRKLKNVNHKLLTEQQKTHNLTTQNLKLEYKFLRAQINPHFLYNVLGFFYTKVNSQNEDAGRGVYLLTEMMRYSIREAGVDDKVNITEEIQAIKNLLELQNLRFEGNTHHKFLVADDLGNYRIAPHLLVTIVENACKHGDLTEKFDPLVIHAKIEGEYFVFTTYNKARSAKPVTNNDESFGLDNLEKRIVMLYRESYFLIYGPVNEGYFEVIFKLKLSEIINPDIKQNVDEDDFEIEETNNNRVWHPA